MPTLSSYIFICIITLGTHQSHQSTTSHYDWRLSCELCLLHSAASTVEIPIHLIALRNSRLRDTDRKEGLETQPCVREHSIVRPNIHPWSTNRGGLGARTRAAARHPQIQLRAPEMDSQPSSPPFFPHSQHSRSQSMHTTTLGVGEGSYGSVVSWHNAHSYCSNLS